MSPRGGTRRVVVLGAGRVGGVVARDLAGESGVEVAVVDASSAALAAVEEASAGAVAPRRADLGDPAVLREVTEGAELVVGALPGPVGFETLRRLVEARRDVVDVSFFEEDPFRLDAPARERGSTVVVDAGLAPGLSNLLLGRATAELDETRRFECLVGGLPADREAPFGYRAPFSPVDVLAEYTRPARIRRDGEEVTLPALSEVERVEVDGVGVLEAFLTDGLRTLLRTVDTPTLIEKTLRYPGHAAAMRGLREAGFFDARVVDPPGVRPLDVTVRLLEEAWRFGEGEADLTVLRAEIRGSRDGEPVRRVWTLLDRFDGTTGTLSMARTTGFTCAAVARLALAGRIGGPGVVTPEEIGEGRDAFDSVVDDLRDRGVALRREAGGA